MHQEALELSKKGFVTVCAWCESKGILTILSFVRTNDPKKCGISHGMCRPCFEEVLEEEFDESTKLRFSKE